MKNAHMYHVGIASVSRRCGISPRRLAVLSIALTLVAGCQTDADPTKGPHTGYDAKAEAACIAEGGAYRLAGAFVQYLCIKPTADAGQSCQKESDCNSLCLAETKTCAPVTPMFGCHSILMEDGEEAEICID